MEGRWNRKSAPWARIPAKVSLSGKFRSARSRSPGIRKPSSFRAESFHAVSDGALTLRGYAEAVAGWFGREAKLKFLPYDQWAAGVDSKLAEMTLDHIAHSPHCSIEKAKRLIDYRPRYTPLEAVRESLQWLIDHGQVKT